MPAGRRCPSLTTAPSRLPARPPGNRSRRPGPGERVRSCPPGQERGRGGRSPESPSDPEGTATRRAPPAEHSQQPDGQAPGSPDRSGLARVGCGGGVAPREGPAGGGGGPPGGGEGPPGVEEGLMLPLRPPLLEFLLRTVVKLLVFTRTFILRKLQSHEVRSCSETPISLCPKAAADPSQDSPSATTQHAHPPRPPGPENVDRQLCLLPGAPSVAPPHGVGPFSPWRTWGSPAFQSLLLKQPCF